MFKRPFKTIVLILLMLQPVFGWSQQGEVVDEAITPSWVAPEIVALSDDWWPNFITENSQVLRIRADLLIASVSNYISGLDADNLLAAQVEINTLSTNLDTALTMQGVPLTVELDALPILDNYSLQQLIDLRKLWRDTDNQLEILQLEQQQLNRQVTLLQQQRDLNLTEYSRSDPSSPARLMAGLNRVNLYLETYSKNKAIEIKVSQQAQLNNYLNEINQKTVYASKHLLTNDLSLATLDSVIQGLNADVTRSSGKMAAAQQQLLDAVSKDPLDTYTILNLKQQLTEVSAKELLARTGRELEYAKRDWLLLKSGATTRIKDLHSGSPASKALLNEATQQSALWGNASQNTLITPKPEKDRKARKAYEAAQATAHRTLRLVKKINATIDNLSLIREQIITESLKLTRGFGGGWLRIQLYTQDIVALSKALMNFSLFHLGEKPVTAGGIVKAMIIFLLFWAASWFIRYFLNRIERRQNFKQGSFYASGRVLHYIILTVAGIVALGSIGLDFSNFALIAGALSVGIGFGLQSVVLNFVSGLILLFEGSIRVGDYVELDSDDPDSQLMGTVKEITSRSTLINTNDNADVIVPNSELVGNRMINWTLRESIARMRIPFSVAYGSDKELVTKAVLEAADEGEFCIHHTPGRQPVVRMISFGDNGLKFELRVWVNRAGVRRPIFVRSSILWAMDSKFIEYGIEVPFPQRDLHVRDDSDLLKPQDPVLEP